MAGTPPAPPGGPPPPPPPPPSSYPPPYAAPPLYAPGAPYAMPGPAPGLRYAGFWIRFLAYFVDSLILEVPLGVIFFLVVGAAVGSTACTPVSTQFGTVCSGLSATTSGLIPLLFLGLLVVTGVYFVVCWSRFGRTPGQRLCGLRVVDAATGGQITTSRAVGRFLGLIVSSWVLEIGLIWAAFDAQKQGWHDKMASTFVVRSA